MKKTIRHEWRKADGIVFNGTDLKQCTKCNCRRFFDFDRNKTTFVDRFGKLYLTTPDCVGENEFV